MCLVAHSKLYFYFIMWQIDLWATQNFHMNFELGLSCCCCCCFVTFCMTDRKKTTPQSSDFLIDFRRKSAQNFKWYSLVQALLITSFEIYFFSFSFLFTPHYGWTHQMLNRYSIRVRLIKNFSLCRRKFIWSAFWLMCETLVKKTVFFVRGGVLRWVRLLVFFDVVVVPNENKNKSRHQVNTHTVCRWFFFGLFGLSA